MLKAYTHASLERDSIFKSQLFRMKYVLIHEDLLILGLLLRKYYKFSPT